MIWHGYPLVGVDRHPERPWWVRLIQQWSPSLPPEPTVWRWVRSDGLEVGPVPASRAEQAEAQLAQLDRDEPLPPPPPKLGQFWVFPDAEQDAMVIGVDRGAAVWAWPWGGGPPVEWPPPSGVLVAGYGAPWAPMGCKHTGGFVSVDTMPPILQCAQCGEVMPSQFKNEGADATDVVAGDIKFIWPDGSLRDEPPPSAEGENDGIYEVSSLSGDKLEIS